MANADNTRPTPIVLLEPFPINPTERRLERNDESVVIGSRSLEILIASVARAGENPVPAPDAARYRPALR